jgi:hypothetical protein
LRLEIFAARTRQIKLPGQDHETFVCHPAFNRGRAIGRRADQPAGTVGVARGKSFVPAALPGKGLAQHDFFYAGEAKAERMLIVRGGKIA